jgi:hypothetical protein
MSELGQRLELIGTTGVMKLSRYSADIFDGSLRLATNLYPVDWRFLEFRGRLELIDYELGLRGGAILLARMS